MFVCIEQPCDSTKHEAHGLCRLHYRRTQPRTPDKKQLTQCFVCGVMYMKIRGGYVPRVGSACSPECRTILNTPDRCKLPRDHIARHFGQSCDITVKNCASCAELFTSRFTKAVYCSATCRTFIKRPAARFTSGFCADCGCMFVAEAHGGPISYCSTRCARRVAKRTRRAREQGAPGSFRYSEIMHVYRLLGRVCAYCSAPAPGLPDPDHVLALSRGGRNDMTNLLPCCPSCNSDKRHLTLSEWAVDRERRGLPPVRTEIDITIEGFKHLVLRKPESMKSTTA